MQATSLPTPVLWYGREEKPGQAFALRAGPVDLVWQDSDLRYIRFGELEIVRRIYTAIRDRYWGTVSPAITNLVKGIREDSFRISFQVENKQDEILFVWKGILEGRSNGTIVYTMDGTAKTTFMKNRIGVCALLPIKECAGHPCTVTRPDGSTEEGTLPEAIAPHQPFFDIQSLRYSVSGEVQVDMRFEGEVFEMEDQRNWIDGSFKVYSTPLRIPFPAQIKAGTRVFHRITLKVASKQSKQSRVKTKTPQDILVSVSHQGASPIPEIGIATNHDGVELTGSEIARLRNLQLSHLRHEIHIAQDQWRLYLQRAVSLSEALQIPLEIGMHIKQTKEDFAEIRSVLAKPVSVCAWLVLDNQDPSAMAEHVAAARAAFCDISPKAQFGVSMSTNFTELNRTRPKPGSVDIAGYAFNPQVHAFDNWSLAENLEPVGHTIRSAAQFLGNTPLTLGPVTLRPRNKPTFDDGIPHAVDVRQVSLLCAGWTCGCIGHSSARAVRRITFFEATGWRGMMERKEGSPVPNVFRSIPGSVFPVYHVLADAGDFQGGTVSRITASDDLAITGVEFHKDGRRRILLANLTDRPRTVILQGLDSLAAIRTMDASNAVEAMQDPIAFRNRPFKQLHAQSGMTAFSVEPFAVTTIDR